MNQQYDVVPTWSSAGASYALRDTRTGTTIPVYFPTAAAAALAMRSVLAKRPSAPPARH